MTRGEKTHSLWVSGRFELLRVRVIGSQLYLYTLTQRLTNVNTEKSSHLCSISHAVFHVVSFHWYVSKTQHFEGVVTCISTKNVILKLNEIAKPNHWSGELFEMILKIDDRPLWNKGLTKFCLLKPSKNYSTSPWLGKALFAFTKLSTH